MALVLGTNSGFVTAAPTTDPDGTALGAGGSGGRGWATRDTSPAGSYKITKMGWYQSLSTNSAADYELGLYSHDAANSRPNVLLSQLTGASLVLNTVGWYDYVANYTLSSSTTYWLAEQNDAESSLTAIDYAVDVGQEMALKDNISTLPDPWGISNTDYDGYILSIYALYEAAAGGLSIPIAMNHYLRQMGA